MSDPQQVSDLPTDNPAGDVDEPSNQADTPKDTVKYDTYRKVLGEKKARDQKLAEVQKQLEELQAQNKAREEQDLADQNKWKELAEMRQRELDEAKQKLTTYDVQQENAAKLEAFLSSLDGKVDRKYWNLIDLDKIVVNPETKEVDEMSVTNLVKNFRNEHSRLIDKPGGPKVPYSAPTQAGSVEDSREEKLKRISAFLNQGKGF